jgi:exonuclease III
VSLAAARTWLVAVVLAALTATVLVLTPATATAAPTPKARLKIGSYNIFAKVSPETFNQGVRAVLPRVDILGLQEVHGKEKGYKLNGMRSLGWDHFRPEAGYKNVVMWKRSRFAKVSGRTVKFTKARWLGAERPSRKTLNENVATVLRLRDRESNQNISIVNVHLAPGAVSAGRRVPGRPRLWDAYTDQVRKMTALAKKEGAWGEVFVVGDFNVGWVSDEKHRKRKLPFASFKRLRMKANWAADRPATGGTRGNALLDGIYAERKARKSSVAFDVRHSDHLPALATYRLPIR